MRLWRSGEIRSDVNGNLTGIRFYKRSGDRRPIPDSLWSSTGTLLATGTFQNETASGWQQMTFSTPVSIVANTTYVRLTTPTVVTTFLATSSKMPV
jgi:hypothetical protein